MNLGQSSFLPVSSSARDTSSSNSVIFPSMKITAAWMRLAAMETVWRTPFAVRQSQSEAYLIDKNRVVSKIHTSQDSSIYVHSALKKSVSKRNVN